MNEGSVPEALGKIGILGINGFLRRKELQYVEGAEFKCGRGLGRLRAVVVRVVRLARTFTKPVYTLHPAQVEVS